MELFRSEEMQLCQVGPQEARSQPPQIMGRRLP